MGKSSKYPGYATGSVEINGNKVATSSKTGKNTYSSSYNMTDTEKSVYDGVLGNLDTSLKDLFSISDAKQENDGETLTFDEVAKELGMTLWVNIWLFLKKRP